MLQIGNPNILSVDFVIFMDFEKSLHSYFSHCKSFNEWFRLPQSYKESLINLCKERKWEFKSYD